MWNLRFNGLIPRIRPFCVRNHLRRRAVSATACCYGIHAIIAVNVNERRIYILTATIDHHCVLRDNYSSDRFDLTIFNHQSCLGQCRFCIFHDGRVREGIIAVRRTCDVINRESDLRKERRAHEEEQGSQPKRLKFFHSSIFVEY